MAKRRTRRRRRMQRHLLRIGIILVPILLMVFFLSMFRKDKNDKNLEETKEVTSQIEEPKEEPKPEPITASILSAGDIIMHDPLLTSDYYQKEDGTFDYNSIFKYIKENYESADFTVVNLESTISDSNYKGYPRFRAPKAIVTALGQNSTDLCLLANNHIYDNYDAGMNMTIDAVETSAMQYMGVRKTTEQSTYLIQEINGIKVGFFNYVFDTGKSGDSVKSINAIPVNNATAPLINTFNYGNTQALYDEIKTGLEEMNKQGVEYTIAYIHWGNEYQTTENDRQRKIAANLCELGIDALIGGHPHVVQPVDLLTNSTGDHQMLCVYSLGNHLSNQYKERLAESMPTGHTEDGLMVNLTLQKNDDETVSLIQADFIPTWVYRTPNESDDGNPEYFILPLTDTKQILKEISLPELETDVPESYARTDAIISAGVSKIHSALPITNTH